mmetsp:Transcript_51342/g.58806  ORF Transcript_51342/g.58806 Transcript_51342/m.58806 type:complete len:101 (+) Transcript_51342:266-568(+)
MRFFFTSSKCANFQRVKLAENRGERKREHRNLISHSVMTKFDYYSSTLWSSSTIIWSNSQHKNNSLFLRKFLTSFVWSKAKQVEALIFRVAKLRNMESPE